VTTDSQDAPSGAVVRGQVKLAGNPPQRLTIDMTQVPECVKVHGTETILNEDAIVGSGGEVKNAFVYVKRAPAPSDDPAALQPAVLNQEKCMYRPRVQGVRVGQKLEIRNSDGFAHNVRGYPQLNPIFNIGQPGKGDVRDKVFELAENPPIKFKCDLHKWMTAYVFVMDHPYFGVTADDGTFEIGGLPPGDYTLAVWHETFGKNQQEIAVGERGVVNADLPDRTRIASRPRHERTESGADLDRGRGVLRRRSRALRRADGPAPGASARSGDCLGQGRF
jgi:hypothetical protein